MKGIIEKYREYLPVTDKTPVPSLNEGNTPLIKSHNLSKQYGINIYFKYEGLNPTGSFKDRGMVMAVAKALEEGSGHIICASTGNTSSSAAAYAARAGIRCTVLIPSGKIAYGKLAQAFIYGARVIPIDGNFDDALQMVVQMSEEYNITLVNSINPYRIEGQKTSAFEIADTLGFSPDYVCLPVGNAGNITSYWKGFREYHNAGKISSLPKMRGFQAEGSCPIVKGSIFKNPETLATAIRIGNPVSWKQALAAAEESGGGFDSVTDEEILKAYSLLASMEGIFAEPASAASLAGLIKMLGQGRIEKGAQVVCILTGNGLKDPDTALNLIEKPLPVPCDRDIISAIIKKE
jgi:threonine synthase